MTDDEDENGRKGHVSKERNHSKTASYPLQSMIRKLSIVPIFLAMMMVTLATVLPHHHHQTMICIVEEVCGMDGCLDDEHTHHSDANHDQDESHCVAHKQYCPSETLHIDHQDFGTDADNIFPILAILSNLLTVNLESAAIEYVSGSVIPSIAPPPVSPAAPNAPPVAA